MNLNLLPLYLIPPFDVFDLLTHNDPHHNNARAGGGGCDLEISAHAPDRARGCVRDNAHARARAPGRVHDATPGYAHDSSMIHSLTSLSDFPSLLDCGSPGF